MGSEGPRAGLNLGGGRQQLPTVLESASGPRFPPNYVSSSSGDAGLTPVTGGVGGVPLQLHCNGTTNLYFFQHPGHYVIDSNFTYNMRGGVNSGNSCPPPPPAQAAASRYLSTGCPAGSTSVGTVTIGLDAPRNVAPMSSSSSTSINGAMEE